MLFLGREPQQSWQWGAEGSEDGPVGEMVTHFLFAYSWGIFFFFSINWRRQSGDVMLSSDGCIDPNTESRNDTGADRLKIRLLKELLG